MTPSAAAAERSSTTLKFMQIMAEKGLLLRNQKQRAHVYEAAKPREWTQRQLAGDLLERAFMRPLNAPTPTWNALSEGDSSGFWNLNLSSIAPWLGPFWFAGLWLVCVWRAANWLFVQRLRRRGLCCASDHWLKKVAGLCAQLRISKPVLLMESCLTDVPVLLGHFRPMILAPVGLLAGLPPEQVEAILLHELAHVGRYDYMVNMLQRLAEALFFYHPAAWWISRSFA